MTDNAATSLPNGWARTNLEQLGEWTSGGTPSKKHKEYYGGSIPWVRTGDLKYSLSLIDIPGRITNDGLQNSSAKILPKKTLIMAMYGATIGKLAILGCAAATNQACAALLPGKANSDIIPFLFYRLMAERQVFVGIGQGGAQPNISQALIKKHEIGLPPLNEQRRIVAKIEALMARSTRAKEALDAIPALLDRYRQSVLAAAFRGDLTADWRAQHPGVEPASKSLEKIREERQLRLLPIQSRRGKRKADGGLMDSSIEPEIPRYELPKGWAMARLADLSWQCSYGISSKCDYNFPGPPVLRIPNVANGQLLLDDLKRAGQEGFKDADSVDLGDLLVVRTNGSRSLIGRGAIITQPLAEPTYFASYLIRFRLLGGIDMARWLSTVWHCPQIRAQVYEHAATSAGQYNISMTELSSFAIPIPPPEELRLICHRAETALASTNTVADQVYGGIERVAVLDQTILGKAFRGELVPQDPNDEPASQLLARIKAERAAAGTPSRRGGRRKRAAVPVA